MKEHNNSYFIPKNFQNGISILGNTYETIYVLQAAMFVIPGWILAFLILPKISFLTWMDFSAKLSVGILWTAVFGFLCINGIQEKPLLQYLKDIKAFKKKWKKAVYNPELTLKTKPIYMEKGDEDLLPRDRVYKLIESYREKQRSKDEASASKMTEDDNRETVYIFDDNMNEKEYRKYLKNQAKLEKKQRKEEAKLNGRNENRKQKSG